jgi:hypothetical protein
MQTAQNSPHPDAALVIQRWNSWVRVLWPATGETRWVDLSAERFEVVAAAGGQDEQKSSR